jgi:hypothetical protein
MAAYVRIYQLLCQLIYLSADLTVDLSITKKWNSGSNSAADQTLFYFMYILYELIWQRLYLSADMTPHLPIR